MHSEFLAIINSFELKLQELLSCPPVKSAAFLKDVPLEGIYLFSENKKHLYVGRTNKIQNRYGLHCNPWSTDNQATFAFRLAREITGKTSPSYKSGSGSRKGLMADPVFAGVFSESKQRVRNMDFRFVSEPDQRKQALLEIYCATILETPYNDFKTT